VNIMMIYVMWRMSSIWYDTMYSKTGLDQLYAMTTKDIVDHVPEINKSEHKHMTMVRY
jgi:hypothetical protein